MMLASIEAAALAIPFKTGFRHASAERSVTQSLWVQATSRDGITGYGEACPREYVTQESLHSARAFILAHREQWLRELHDLASLAAWVAGNERLIDRHPSAWAGVELALLDLFGKRAAQSVDVLVGLPELAGSFRYTAVLGDAEPGRFEAQLAQYLQAGFSQFKLKLSGVIERDRAKLALLKAAGIAPDLVRADANNLWPDAASALPALAALDFPFAALEEPLRAGDYAGMKRISAACGVPIILDESLLRMEQLELLGDAAQPWIVNLRVSKMGGLLRSLKLVQALRKRGQRLVIGAHVGETSVLTRAALSVAHAAHDILWAQEGAFGTRLLQADVCQPPLMFGQGGMLEAAAAGAGSPGLGLDIQTPALYICPNS